ncbi:hypothetical protein ACULL3_13565 [Xanthomonas arboricola pv. corylina]|uniref:hypothetical protein n=1 Tax=Xanthomonas TaxID=338 RepID=UPI0025A17738|nr:hypothetical protein [Xanthomonas campestris]MDM7876033.1 hypothetical protein [Xanthomonas campestris pv. campestris]
MPQFLTRSTVRLLEASVDSLSLALTAAAIPLRHVPKSSEASFAAVIGMAGVAAEQAISSILIQVNGDEAAYLPNNKYKPAAQILAEVRGILASPPVARAAFLTSGLDDANAHRQALLKQIELFTLLIKQRAVALHGGTGVSRGVALLAVRKVHGFLHLLGQSQRIATYLKSLPDLIEPATEPYLILDELVARFATAKTATHKGVLLQQLFLVLPEVPLHAPDWLDALDRVAALPREGDISLLITTLQTAEPARLSRLTGAGRALPVVLTTAAGAMPIAMQALRSQFNNLHDQIGADVGSANGRLRLGVLDLPPDKEMLGLFALDIPDLLDAFGGASLTAHQAWPFVATALNTRNGLSRPYWFLVRQVGDLGQLRALLTQAARAGNPNLAQRITQEALVGIETIERGRQLPTTDPLLVECQENLVRVTTLVTQLRDAVERQSAGSKGLTLQAGEAVCEIATGFGTITEAWAAIEADGLATATNRLSARAYWARKLAEASYEPNDVGFLTAILLDQDLTIAHTSARRALRLIDATRHGPSMTLQP